MRTSTLASGKDIECWLLRIQGPPGRETQSSVMSMETGIWFPFVLCTECHKEFLILKQIGNVC